MSAAWQWQGSRPTTRVRVELTAVRPRESALARYAYPGFRMPWDDGLNRNSPAHAIAADLSECIRVVAGPGTGAGWTVRLHEKVAKQHAMPRYHALVEALRLKPAATPPGRPGSPPTLPSRRSAPNLTRRFLDL